MHKVTCIGAVVGWVVATLVASASLAYGAPSAPERKFVIDFDKPAEKESPRIGFLGGLRDDTPDALIEPLHPALWRVGHQFRGRIAGGLPAAIARVEKLGATYKLVMSDLIGTGPKDGKDWPAYEAAVKKLVAQTGDRSASIIWEVSNEPDTSKGHIDAYYELYSHAFKALREADKSAAICGPSFAFPSYDKYKAFLDYCRENHLECNDLSWHYTGWDPSAPESQKWQLGRMREFPAAYPDQKIREIQCDEWGAGPDKPTLENPGRLQPGRAVVWFYYLQDVYKVDRACRANWGKQDDYLGGFITPGNEPLPAYHAYRFYGSSAGMRRIQVEGNDREMAVLAHQSEDQNDRQVLLGSVKKGAAAVTLEMRGLPAARAFALKVLPGADINIPMTTAQVPSHDFKLTRHDGITLVSIDKVEENQAYFLQITPQ